MILQQRKCIHMCITTDISPVVADHLLVLLLALFCILGQLPNALTPNFLTIVFPKQPHLLLILCLYWVLPICCCLDLKPRQDQSGEQQKS